MRNNLLSRFSVNRYYRMEDSELEAEASRWKIRSYGNANGSIERQVIIDALLKKDNANNSRYAIAISFLALVISTVLVFFGAPRKDELWQQWQHENFAAYEENITNLQSRVEELEEAVDGK